MFSGLSEVVRKERAEAAANGQDPDLAEKRVMKETLTVGVNMSSGMLKWVAIGSVPGPAGAVAGLLAGAVWDLFQAAND